MDDWKLNARTVVKLYRWFDVSQVLIWHAQQRCADTVF